MERNDNDHNRVTADYEPNFILKDPEGSDTDGPIRAMDPLKEEAPKATEAPKTEPSMTTESVTPKAAPTTTESVTPKTEAPKPNSVTEPTQVLKVEEILEELARSEAAKTESNRPSRPAGTSQPTGPISDRATGSVSERATGSMSERATGPVPQRPLFENPSFDEGERSAEEDEGARFTDPRRNFRYGESTSWRAGETSRTIPNRNIRKEKKARKASKPITLSRKMLAGIIIGALLLSSAFGFGGAMVGYNMLDSYYADNQKKTEEEATTGKTETAGYSLESSTGSDMSVKEVTAAAKDSVVEIRTEGVTSDSWMQEYVTQGAGSGVIISKDGYIMTNNHVIDGANKIKVTTSNEKEYDAKLIGTDDSNDVAVLKVDASDLKAATYGNSDELEVGDLAVAIGNPLGELGGTVTAGIISAKDRAISIDGKTLHLLQTDSSINPGNSGGGLFNDDGQLIGLVVAKSSGSDVEGLGFAIPINTAANVAQQLIDKGFVSGQPSTGMSYQEGSQSGTFDSFFGGGSESQVYIYSVNGENAKKAGFEPGDVVLAVDGEEITSFNDLSAIITSHKVGDTVTFTIQRDGKEQKIKLKLEEKQVSQNSGGSQESQDPGDEQAPDMEQMPDGSDEDEFAPFPEDEGGSLFDYFFGR